MIDVNELRRKTTFTHDGNLLRVLDYEHRKMGRGKATIRVKVLNIRTGSRFEITFNSGERVENIRLEKRTYEYLYDDGTFLVFMATDDYSQKQVSRDVFGDDVLYLKDNAEVELLDYEDEVLDYNLPITVEMEVIDSEVAIAGDTASSTTKEVTLETGLKVRTPLFVEVGDVLKVNTETGLYITRV